MALCWSLRVYGKFPSLGGFHLRWHLVDWLLGRLLIGCFFDWLGWLITFMTPISTEKK